MFQYIFSSLVRSKYLSLFSFSLMFTLRSAKTAKLTIRQVLAFFFSSTITWSSLLAGIWWSVCIWKLWASHFSGWILVEHIQSDTISISSTIPCGLPSIPADSNSNVVKIILILLPISNSFLFHVLGDSSKSFKYTWYDRHSHATQLFKNPCIGRLNGEVSFVTVFEKISHVTGPFGSHEKVSQGIRSFTNRFWKA